MKLRFIGFFGALALAGTTCTGLAATVTNVSASADCGGIFAKSDTRSGPVHVTSAANTLNCTSIASARAGAGFVGVSAVAAGQSNTDGESGAASAHSGATATFDIVFTVPDTYTGGLIDISANFFYTGLMSAEPRTRDIFNLTATVGYSGFFELRGKVSNLTSVADKAAFRDTETKTVQRDTDGPAAALGTEVVSVTNVLNIDPSYGASVRMNLQAHATTAFNSTARSSAFASFYDSLSFAKSGPVFNLPTGFSAFSADGSIVDNIWADPRIPVSATTVPVPASFLLMMAGGVAIGATRRKRRRQEA